MADWQLNTPIAFIIFNRPASTEKVFDQISRAKPKKLLVIADGPREHKVGEAETCAKTRAIIDRVDWECQVLTNYSERNLGCKKRVSSGIDWVFEQVEEAIILEDDCVPDTTFFRYCEELLQRYRHDQRIGMISGDNFQFGQRRNDDSYYYSKYVHIWGWATWRDRWLNSYDVSLLKWPHIRDGAWLPDLVGNEEEAKFWANIFDRVYRGEIDTWDYQWVFANWLEGRATILPNVNLIKNIGFDANATHTTGSSDLANLATVPITFPLKHPIAMVKSLMADSFSRTKCFQVPFYVKIRNKFAGIFQ